MKLRWSETAFGELEEILAFIAQRSPAAATVVAERIFERTTSLQEFPRSGPVTDSPGVRALSVVSHPFVVFYSIDESAGEVLILNIRHTAQDRSSATD